MQSDLSFLPNNLSADPSFQLRWRHAVMAINKAAKSDLDLGSVVRKKAIHAAADRTISAAFLLRNEIDDGVFAQIVQVNDVAMEYGFPDDDVQTVRRFLNLLAQHVLVTSHQTAEHIPKIIPKQSTRTAAYFTGRLCAEFGLGVPTDYASADHGGESVSISLMRCLLIESRAASKPSKPTLRRGMALAIEGYNALLKIKTTTSD